MAAKKDKAVNKARIMAAEIVYEVMERGAFANLALAKALRNSDLSAADRHLLTEIVNGTVRMIKHLDWVLELFLHSPIKKQNPCLLSILRTALYQLMFLAKVPDYALVNDAVEISRQKMGDKMAGVSNAVLRNIIRKLDKIKYPDEPVSFYSIYYSHPEWLVKLWLDTFGTQACETLLAYNNSRSRVVLRCNPLKCSREELIDKLGEEGVKAQLSPLTPWGIVLEDSPQPIAETASFKKGYFYIQNEASMLAAAILNPPAGERVLDLCCGVGGKTTQLAEYMNNQGEVLAVEFYAQKLELLRQNCQRLGLGIVKDLEKDIRTLNSKEVKARYLLLDAPCSGWGVLNRRADARWRKNQEEINELTRLQAQFISHAAAMVEEQGYLLYATCTINQAENEEIIEGFLEQNQHFVLEGFSSKLSFFPLDKPDKASASRGMLTLMPGKYETDGMFYALLRRKQFK
ncbi:16S rRNA (cytosine(967)-C(5))-methyltransferase RsmB [Syntrophomonas wolfei]|uniref:16S rRNA (cytosine(967)-C(5))-methyltransferase RsmB n=1 Tax=Syntrophomonas wolfei TaxID=863 RepID=UPI000773DCE1|nr:16S rRNA (cytosine(967)-C(5))-methyltransferase RsmB [Syntrophomonas wolfei]